MAEVRWLSGKNRALVTSLFGADQYTYQVLDLPGGIPSYAPEQCTSLGIPPGRLRYSVVVDLLACRAGRGSSSTSGGHGSRSLKLEPLVGCETGILEVPGMMTLIHLFLLLLPPSLSYFYIVSAALFQPPTPYKYYYSRDKESISS